jgi:hypothetical protein
LSEAPTEQTWREDPKLQQDSEVTYFFYITPDIWRTHRKQSSKPIECQPPRFCSPLLLCIRVASSPCNLSSDESESPLLQSCWNSSYAASSKQLFCWAFERGSQRLRQSFLGNEDAASKWVPHYGLQHGGILSAGR